MMWSCCGVASNRWKAQPLWMLCTRADRRTITASSKRHSRHLTEHNRPSQLSSSTTARSATEKGMLNREGLLLLLDLIYLGFVLHGDSITAPTGHDVRGLITFIKHFTSATEAPRQVTKAGKGSINKGGQPVLSTWRCQCVRC